jgi:hypothetical protein
MKRSALFLSVGAAVMLLASGALAGQAKVEICHVPPGNPDNARTISVSENAVAKHVEKHGDIACSCEAIDDCAAQGGELDTETCECATGCPCDNGVFCDGVETLNSSGRCQVGTAPCDAATEKCNETDDVCEARGDCQSDADCNHNDACFSEYCIAGKCVASPSQLCFQPDGCSTAFCDSQTGCVFQERTCQAQQVCVPGGSNNLEWSWQAP